MNRRSVVLLLLSSSTMASCSSGNYGESVEPGGNIEDFMAIQEARSMVCALEYVVEQDKLDEVPVIYSQMDSIFADPSRAGHFKDHAKTHERMAGLVAEIKPLLTGEPPDVDAARPLLQELVELADSLPGDEIKIEEVWSVD